MRDIVRAVVQLMRAMAPSLAQHHRVRERRAPRRDMHGRTAREVKTAEPVRPPGRVPRPAGNRVVDDRRPHEHEDDAGEHAPALGDGAHGEGDGDGAEHALVDGEEEVRDAGRADRGLREDVAEAKVFEVANEAARRVREGERVAPEEPLEGRDRRRHDGQPDQGQGRFPSCQAGVEEPVIKV